MICGGTRKVSEKVENRYSTVTVWIPPKTSAWFPKLRLSSRDDKLSMRIDFSNLAETHYAFLSFLRQRRIVSRSRPRSSALRPSVFCDGLTFPRPAARLPGCLTCPSHHSTKRRCWPRHGRRAGRDLPSAPVVRSNFGISEVASSLSRTERGNSTVTPPVTHCYPARGAIWRGIWTSREIRLQSRIWMKAAAKAKSTSYLDGQGNATLASYLDEGVVAKWGVNVP